MVNVQNSFLFPKYFSELFQSVLEVMLVLILKWFAHADETHLHSIWGIENTARGRPRAEIESTAYVMTQAHFLVEIY